MDPDSEHHAASLGSSLWIIELLNEVDFIVLILFVI